jgi:hypothetical protein
MSMNEQTPSLPLEGAFVVQFAVGTDPLRGRFTGRVEQVSSGASTHFQDLKGFLGFMRRVLSPVNLARP